jgi:hypothetical protein
MQFFLSAAAAAALLLAACSIPDSQFEATSGDAGPDGAGAVLAIMPSATQLELAENGTAELTIALSQAPSAPLTVTVAADAAKLALGQPSYTFTPESFAEPQRLALTALPDADADLDHVELTLSASDVTGVAAVTVTAAISDDDTLQLATNIGAGGVVSINEAGSTTVRVHLTARPRSDVRVEALVAAGPVTVTGPTSRTFTPENYDVDQVFTFAAAADANVSPEDLALTLRGPGLPDVVATLRTVDDDTLNLLVAPSTLEVTEQGAAGIVAVSLTQQPATDVVVTITTTTGKAAVSPTQITIPRDTYSTPRNIEVTGRDDADVANASDTVRFNAAGLTERAAAITILDNDTQQILVDLPSNPLAVTEGGSATFNVTLRYQPSADVVLAVSSLATGVATVSTSSLSFTSTNYNQPRAVTVSGTQDGNLTPNSTSVRLLDNQSGLVTQVAVAVADNDTQAFVVTPSTLLIPEGQTRTFDVSLAFDPGGTVTGTVVSSDAAALPVSPATLSFSSATYATPIRVTVAPPVDADTTDETAAITMSGCGAPANATVNATVDDGTTLLQYGWPTPFPDTALLARFVVVAYKIRVTTTSPLDSFGIWVPAGGNDYRLALYSNANAQPSGLIASMPARRTLAGGFNTADLTPDVSVPAGDYWLVIRLAQNSAVGISAAAVTGTQCVRASNITNLDDPWPTAFGQSFCSEDRLPNLWINNYVQP